jgi:hypothetical protein
MSCDTDIGGCSQEAPSWGQSAGDDNDCNWACRLDQTCQEQLAHVCLRSDAYSADHIQVPSPLWSTDIWVRKVRCLCQCWSYSSRLEPFMRLENKSTIVILLQAQSDVHMWLDLGFGLHQTVHKCYLTEHGLTRIWYSFMICRHVSWLELNHLPRKCIEAYRNK